MKTAYAIFDNGGTEICMVWGQWIRSIPAFEAGTCVRPPLVQRQAWYVSHVSIFYEAFMLYYYLFWMITGFIIHFYITFGSNLLTGGPAHIAVLLPVSVFRRKGISNGVQTEWNLRERDFLNKRDLGDLEWASRNNQGGHEAGGRAYPPGAPSMSWF